MHDKNKDKKLYRTEEISFKWLLFWQYWQEPDLEPNQKSMVELFCKNDLVVVLFKLFSIWEREQRLQVMLDRWLSYTVTILREFAWTDSALVVFDCNTLS